MRAARDGTLGAPARVRGAAIAETIIALPILLAVILGAIQFGLIYQAKATLNHAALQAARAGAVDHASPEAIRRGLARGLAPLYSPDSSLTGVLSTLGRIEAELTAAARIRILNPTREAFEDFAETVDGTRELPNDRLHTRSTALGPRSGLNIQDANLLRVEITYGYELKVPLVNWFITRTLLAARGSRTYDAFGQQLLRRTRLPITATSTVRMQSAARISDLVVSRADLPAAQRFDAGAQPPPVDDEPTEEGDDADGQASRDDAGSSLADGFFGFGEGAAPAQRNDADGDHSGGGSSGSDTPPWLGGDNSGNPQMCETPADNERDWPFGPADTTSNPTSQGIALPALSVGNPIHVVTGNKYQREIDLVAPDNGIEFVRHYNSDSVNRRGTLGAGWRHTFDVTLEPATAQDELVAIQADGRHVRFRRDDQRANYLAYRAGDGFIATDGENFVWHTGRDRTLHFDRDGRLRAVRVDRGELQLAYDRHKRLTTVSDRPGRTLRFKYDSAGRLSRLITPLGAWRYRYDRAGNLVAVAAPNRTARRYEYADSRHPHHLTSVSVTTLELPRFGARQQRVQLGAWTYDERGRGILSTHPGETGRVTLSYGDSYTDVTDVFGRTTRYRFEIRQGTAVVTEVQGPGCDACGNGETRFEYNERLQLVARHKHTGESTYFEYEPNGRLAEISHAPAGETRRWQVRYRYGEHDFLTRIERPSVNPNGVHTIEFVPTASGQVKAAIERGFTSLGDGRYEPIERTFRFEYDARDRLVAIDGPRADVDDTVRIRYDETDRPIAIINPDGLERRIVTRDELGRPERIRTSGIPDIQRRYDFAGRISEVIVNASTGPRSTRIAYDLVGRVLSIERPDGSAERIDRDDANRVVSRAKGGATFARLTTLAPDGKPLASALFNAKGATANQVFYAYDERRRLIELRDGDGPPLRQLRYTDDDDLPDGIVDALGHIRTLRYDTHGRIVEMHRPGAGSLQISYTERGLLDAVIAPNGATTRYEYDDFGRRIREHSPDRGTTHYIYDAANNLVRKIDAQDHSTRLAYTAGGLLASVTSTDGATHFSYRNGQLVRVQAASSNEAFEYDRDGNLARHIRTIQGKTYATEYRYNRRGQLVAERLPSGKWLEHAYNAQGQRVRTVLVRFGADALLLESIASRTSPTSAIGQLRLGNGIELRTQLDSRGRIKTRRIGGISDWIYEYDEENRITNIKEATSSTRYRHDAVGQLIAADSDEWSLRYQYDENGNRSIASRRDRHEATARTVTHRYTPASNRLADSDSTVRVSFDRNGNPFALDNRRYEYDGAGRLRRIFIDDALHAEYAYNAWGERIAKTVHTRSGPRTTAFIYENHRLLAEIDGSGKIAREYVYVDHHPAAVIEGNRIHWIHTDHLGTPLAITDINRRIVWRARYEPFGRATVDPDPDRDGKAFTMNLRFPGQYADQESGLHYNLMRYYDPDAGRYLTPDPLGLMAGTNPYSYASNLPTQRFDSLGLYDEMVHYYITYFLGIVAGLPQDVARTIAIATQYIDENPLTKPLDGPGANTRALPLYHFVMSQQGPLYGDQTSDPLRRFYNPSSPQLDNLFASTDPQRLFDLWREVHPDRADCAAPSIINDARYQLFGEFLHAYEDTFAHRDTENLPYGINPNRDNDPIAFLGGHTGLGDPLSLSYEPPDETFNQDLPDKHSRCDSYWPTPTYGLTREECEEMGGLYRPAYDGDWKYNELRTLRMQYEVLNLLRTNFADEIEANRALYAESPQPLKTATWADLAGHEWDDANLEANARIGVDQTYEEWLRAQGLTAARAILQQVNSSTLESSERAKILNEWLKDYGFIHPTGQPIEIESWNTVRGSAPVSRQQRIGWIPSGYFVGVLVPSDAKR